MIRRIDACVSMNALRPLSPMWKSLFTALMFVLASTLHPVLQAVITVWMMVWCTVYAQIPLRVYGLLSGTALLFCVLGMPALLLEFGHPAGGQAEGIFQLSVLPLYITADGLQRAGLLLARVAACMSCFLFLICTTPFHELLQVLRRLRMPQIVLELMLIMYRFLFILGDTAQGMLLARTLRGGKRGFRARLCETAEMAGALFAGTMRRYYGLSQGLTARGYTGEIMLPPYVPRAVPLKYSLQAYAGIVLLLLAQWWIVSQ